VWRGALRREVEAAERAREEAEGRARQAERRLQAFVADAGHELRRPLTTLRGVTEAFRPETAATDPTVLDDLVRRVQDSSLHMARLVDDLLLLARLDQQRPLASAPVDLVTTARDAADAARVVAQDREIVFTGDQPVEIVGDETRLRHVASNLVDNAVAHTPAGTRVEVEVGRTQRNGSPWAALEVRDHGPGLTPDQAERVFDRFYRTEQARRRDSTGSGLGLAIVDAIVTAHGGIAEVDTSSRQGTTTFRILLPLAAEAADGAD